MNLAARFNTTACAAVLVGSLTFCLADDRPILALLTIPIVFAGWLCGVGDRESVNTGGERQPIALPRVLVNLLVLAAIINAAMRAGGARSVGQPIVSHLGEFLIYVQLLKLFDRRTVRDESQLLTLSVFVCIAAVLTSNNLITGVGVIAYTPLAIAATMLYQLRAGQARAAEGRTPTSDAPAETDPARRRGFSRQLTQTAWLCVLTAGFLGAVIFIVTPRGLGVGALGQFGQPHAMIGFDDHIDLGRAGLLSESSTPVIDMAVQDEQGNNMGSPYRVVYLRGFARDEYDRNSWVRSERSKDAITTLDFDSASKTLLPIGKAKLETNSRLVQRITIRPSISGESYVFGAWRPLSIRTNDPTSGKITFDTVDGTIKRPKTVPSTFTYTLESLESAVRTELAPTAPLGFQVGKVHDLAVSILRDRNIGYPLDSEPSTPRNVANAFRDYLRATCTYTLDLWAPAEGRDPLEEFLFSKKTGHCQYFASALVAMCQSVGIHARVVGGFVAAEYNSITGTYLVRQSNAHAWAEYHTGDGAWTTVDPTPTADLDRIHRAAGGWLASVRRWWDTLEFGWNRSIVSFDSERQSDAIGRGNPSTISAWFARMSDRLTRGLSGREMRSLIPAWAFYIVPAFMLLATLAIVTGRLSRVRIAKVLRLRPRERDPELRQLLASASFYAQALRTLDKAGPPMAKPDDRPPLAHAEQLAPQSPAAAAAIRTISEAYYAVRFGRRPLSREQVSQATGALQHLKEAVRDGGPAAPKNSDR